MGELRHKQVEVISNKSRLINKKIREEHSEACLHYRLKDNKEKPATMGKNLDCKIIDELNF